MSRNKPAPPAAPQLPLRPTGGRGGIRWRVTRTGSVPGASLSSSRSPAPSAACGCCVPRWAQGARASPLPCLSVCRAVCRSVGRSPLPGLSVCQAVCRSVRWSPLPGLSGMGCELGAVSVASFSPPAGSRLAGSSGDSLSFEDLPDFPNSCALAPAACVPPPPPVSAVTVCPRV